MKIACTGANGYIGKALVKIGVLPICADILQPTELKREIEEKKPDIILHLAGKSDPDWCERLENRDAVFNVNVRGTLNVFYRASIEKIPCVFLSTGQIWKGGFWEREHRENDKKTPPVNVYGISKLGAENTVGFFIEDGCKAKIIRSSFVFDVNRLAGKFEILRDGGELHEPTFIKRSFIYLQDFIGLLVQYCYQFDDMPTVLHLAGSETVSWHEFMREIAKQYLLDKSLVVPRRSEIPFLAPRPGNAGLNVSLAQSLGFQIPNYIDGIKRMKHES